jgi:nucleoside-diphosphate-sugar epimerase
LAFRFATFLLFHYSTMPTVLITGLNGFVAVHTALVYLANGWDVRGTFRSQSKADKTLAIPSWGDAVEKGKVVAFIVEDLMEGDFTKALEGVDAVSSSFVRGSHTHPLVQIAHCASPWHFNGKSWAADYRDPAVRGTTNILEQAAKVPSVLQYFFSSFI